MKFVMRNKEFGLKVIAPSEASRDNILANSKLINGQPVWEQFSVLPDDVVEKHSELDVNELRALLAAKEEYIKKLEDKNKPKAESADKPQEKRRGRPKKQSETESAEVAHESAEEVDQKEEG